MREKKLDPRRSWLVELKQTIARSRGSLTDAEEILQRIQKHRDPGISPLELARQLYKARRLRERFFSPDLFAEPAWDLLLDLYIAYHEGRDVRTSGACAASNVSATTGLRWLDRFEKAGLIERSQCPEDARLVFVALTDQTAEQMTDLLNQIALLFPFKRVTP